MLVYDQPQLLLLLLLLTLIRGSAQVIRSTNGGVNVVTIVVIGIVVAIEIVRMIIRRICIHERR